jgi:hypothetical protein
MGANWVRPRRRSTGQAHAVPKATEAGPEMTALAGLARAMPCAHRRPASAGSPRASAGVGRLQLGRVIDVAIRYPPHRTPPAQPRRSDEARRLRAKRKTEWKTVRNYHPPRRAAWSWQPAESCRDAAKLVQSPLGDPADSPPCKGGARGGWRPGDTAHASLLAAVTHASTHPDPSLAGRGVGKGPARKFSASPKAARAAPLPAPAARSPAARPRSSRSAGYAAHASAYTSFRPPNWRGR